MLDQLIEDRRRKLRKLKEAGVDPYPIKTPRTISIAAVRKDFAKLARAKKKTTIAGRIIGLRDQGGVIFLDVRDGSGQMQAVLNKKSFKEFKLFKATLDMGDFVAVAGIPFKTKKGEASIEARALTMLAKSLRPMPTEHFGLEDEEKRLRQRYLDLNLDPETREMFRKKAVFWQTFRQGMLEAGFLEVDLPVLEQTPGGAEAEPFVTHHNALDQDFYLRISLELPLKKLLVGGYEKVFEIGRIFRNEGISKEHLQDYTQLEFYWAYADYDKLMKFVEKLYKQVIKATMGTLTTTRDGKKINWGRKWTKVDYVAAFNKEAGMDPLEATDKELAARAKALRLETEPGMSRARLIDLIFKKTVRPKLVQPCFLVDPPVDIEPLAKRSPEDPRRVERMQVMAAGTELGKGFSELNDPLDQRERFEQQEQARAAGDKEAQQLDEDYLEAMEYGMPPNAGFGLSERLFSVLMDRPIRETVIFPLMRPKE